jgi:hypothetical protein
MSYCEYKEFLRELEDIQGEMRVWGHDYDLMQLIFSLKNKVKDFFPMNGVPQEIFDSLNIAQERLKIACHQLNVTCEKIKIEIENMKQKEEKTRASS